MRHSLFIIVLGATLVLAGCRGMESEQPPVHPNLNMDFQERFDPQEPNPFFDGATIMRGASQRPPVAGTVARGLLREDTRFHLGRTETGAYVEDMPIPLTRELLLRGQERYNIFCAVCHGKAGNGLGIIMTGGPGGGGYGYTPATSYHDARIIEASDGYLYDVVANGVRNMPGYAAQIPVADRWAIVAYIRALQRSQNATAEDVPPSVLANIDQGSSANVTGGAGAADPAATGGSADTDDADSAP